MRVDARAYRSIWLAADGWAVEIIDQARLPFHFAVVRLESAGTAMDAIRRMLVRGAPLIGATAAYGLCLGLREEAHDGQLERLATELIDCRPTAVNLRWAVARMLARLRPLPAGERLRAAYGEAALICDEDVAVNEAIGTHGLGLIEALHRRKNKEPVRILTHCNAGWLATVDYGTALAPIYAAFDSGIDVHVWVSETRPRNQGLLTAWELEHHGVPHTLIADNAAGLLMRVGKVDAVIVGADRIAANGDVANKIGTYLKALACADNGIPFYVAAPSSTIDFACPEGADIPIEERSADELRFVHGLDGHGQPSALRQLPDGEDVANPAFDVTPGWLVKAIISERGICPASAEGLATLYPESRHE